MGKLVVLLVAALMAGGCANHGPRVVVASKNFTEQVILGEIAAQQIERKLKIEVVRRLNLGGTLLAHQALVKGDVDLYPEYTGTALTAVLKKAPTDGREKVFDIVSGEYRKLGVEWLPPLGFNNSFAMVIRGDEARSLGIKTLSDAVAKRRRWKVGMGYEFSTREDGLPLLQKTYGLETDGAPITMDLGLLYQALGGHQVDMAAGNATDGILSQQDFVVMADNQAAFPPYEAAFVVRKAILDATPGLGEALSRLSGKLDTATMQRLNFEVDGKKRSARDVAAEFLKSVD